MLYFKIFIFLYLPGANFSNYILSPSPITLKLQFNISMHWIWNNSLILSNRFWYLLFDINKMNESVTLNNTYIFKINLIYFKWHEQKVYILNEMNAMGTIFADLLLVLNMKVPIVSLIIFIQYLFRILIVV